MNQQFSICIITRNEAEKLNKCLKAAQQLHTEIVVVDTGSSDSTLDVMHRYHVKTGHFKWCDNFAMAKNYAAGLASNDWILTLDTDEYITSFDLAEIQNLMEKHPASTGCIRRKNHFIQNGEQRTACTQTDRLYNRKLYEYQGRIHEQLIWIGHSSITRDNPVNLHFSIDHDSYENTETGMKEKALRNKRLLLLDLQEFGDRPYTLFQLGKSCYTLNEYEQAANYFSRGLEFDLDPDLEYVVDMVETYGYALINSGQVDVALGLESVYDAFCHRAGFVFLMGTIYMHAGMLNEAVEQFLYATTLPQDETEGTNSYLAYYNLGVIYECSGLVDEARKYYKKCGAYTRAKDRLKAI